MKRFIVVVAFALSGAPALADAGAPFEQNELDRAILATPETVLLAAVGGLSYKSDEGGESPWGNDHNFIAPAQ